MHRLWSVIIGTLLSCASLAAPATQPGRPGYRLVQGQWISSIKIESWQKLLDARIVEGQLEVQVSIDKLLDRQFVGGRRVAAEVGQSPLVWVLSRSEFKAGMATQRGVYLQAVGLPAAPIADEGYRLSAVMVDPTGIVVRGDGKIENRDATCELRYDRVKGFLSLRIVDGVPGEQPRGLQANAADLRMLLLEHGDAMRLYVVPLLNELAGQPILQPRAADVYRLFPEIPATPEGIAKLTPILQLLSDPDPKLRDKGDDALNRSGDDVVLAAMRATNLNAQQQGAVRRFLVRRQLLLDTQIERMREELPYQIDLLDFDDRAVRERAKARIERINDEKLNFDLDLEGAQRTRQVEKLRLQMTRPLD